MVLRDLDGGKSVSMIGFRREQLGNGWKRTLETVNVIHAITRKRSCLESLDDCRSLCIVRGDDTKIEVAVVLFDECRNNVGFFCVL